MDRQMTDRLISDKDVAQAVMEAVKSPDLPWANGSPRRATRVGGGGSSLKLAGWRPSSRRKPMSQLKAAERECPPAHLKLSLELIRQGPPTLEGTVIREVGVPGAPSVSSLRRTPAPLRCWSHPTRLTALYCIRQSQNRRQKPHNNLSTESSI